MVPLTFFSQVAKWTHKYCYEDWVVESFGKDRDGDAKRVRHFEDVPAQIERGVPYPGRRHRADKEKKKYTITTGFVLCWMGMLILQGAHFGADKRSAAKMWRGQPYGTSILYIQNTMIRNANVCMRQYIHFCNNSKRKAKGDIGYNALFKVNFAL